MSKADSLELVSTSESLSPAERDKRLAHHSKNIRTFVSGARKGAAELYGYAYLAGREMIAAKAILPHGNGDAEGGFTKWLEKQHPDITTRQCRTWRNFAIMLDEKRVGGAAADSKKSPLQLCDKGRGKITKKDRAAILDLVPSLMDGKTMTAFMRDSQFAKDPAPLGRRAGEGGRGPDLAIDESVEDGLTALRQEIALVIHADARDIEETDPVALAHFATHFLKPLNDRVNAVLTRRKNRAAISSPSRANL